MSGERSFTEDQWLRLVKIWYGFDNHTVCLPHEKAEDELAKCGLIQDELTDLLTEVGGPKFRDIYD